MPFLDTTSLITASNNPDKLTNYPLIFRSSGVWACVPAVLATFCVFRPRFRPPLKLRVVKFDLNFSFRKFSHNWGYDKIAEMRGRVSGGGLQELNPSVTPLPEGDLRTQSLPRAQSDIQWGCEYRAFNIGNIQSTNHWKFVIHSMTWIMTKSWLFRSWLE